MLKRMPTFRQCPLIMGLDHALAVCDLTLDLYIPQILLHPDPSASIGEVADNHKVLRLP